jgi:hypothetical protein
MELEKRFESVLAKLLRKGLGDKVLVDTCLNDWDNSIRVEPVAAIPESYAKANLTPATFEHIKTWLKSHKKSFKPG